MRERQRKERLSEGGRGRERVLGRGGGGRRREERKQKVVYIYNSHVKKKPYQRSS